MFARALRFNTRGAVDSERLRVRRCHIRAISSPTSRSYAAANRRTRHFSAREAVMESGPCYTCPNAIGVLVSAVGRYRTCCPENCGRCVRLHRYKQVSRRQDVRDGLKLAFRRRNPRVGLALACARLLCHTTEFQRVSKPLRSDSLVTTRV